MFSLRATNLILHFFLHCSCMLLLAGTTGKIVGNISDNKGESLIGCNIIVDKLSQGASTDLNGKYYIVNIPAGEYTITASMIGYKTLKIKNVNISSDFTTTLNLKMEICGTFDKN